MPRREEKRTPLDFLKHKLTILGLEKEPAAKSLLDALAPANIPGDLVDAVNNMVSIAVITTKQRTIQAFQAVIDDLKKVGS